MRHSYRTITLIFAFICLAPNVWGKTAYIRDELYVPIRGGESAEYRILHQGLKSGTPMEVLSENADTAYSRVRLASGLEGYILTQYLVDEPIARDKLAATTATLTKLGATHQQALRTNEQLQSDLNAMTGKLDETTRQLADRQTELERITALAADTIGIEARNIELAADIEQLQHQIDGLNMANDKLQDSSAQEWFVRGGVVVIIALILGFLAARGIYNRRASGWV